MAMHRITSSHRFSSSLNRFLIVSALLSVIPGLAIADWILPPDVITYVDTDGGNTQARLIDTDASGTVHLVWVESFSGGIFPPGTKVFYNKKPAGGSFDAAPFVVDVITTNFWIKNASVYASANGDVHVVWQKLVGGDWDIYYRKFQFGVGWGSVETVTSDATSNERPKVVAETNGEIHSIWTTTNQIHYKRRDTTTGWDVSSTRLDSTGSASGAHDLTIDQNSTLVAVWSEVVSGSQETVGKTRPSGGPWDAILTVISPIDAVFSGTPTAAVDDSGLVHVVYWDGRTTPTGMFVRKWDLSSGVRPTDELLVAGPNAPSKPQLAADSTGQVHLVWAAGNSDIGYRRYKNGAWDLTASDSSVTVDQPGTVSTNNFPLGVSSTTWGTPQAAWSSTDTFEPIHVEEMPAGLRKATLPPTPTSVESGIYRFGSTDSVGIFAFDIPDPAVIREARLIYSFSNFDYMVDFRDPWPEVGRNYVSFFTYVDDSLAIGHTFRNDTTFKKVELDITGFLMNTDSTKVRFQHTDGDDDFLIVLPTLVIWDTLGTLVSIPYGGLTRKHFDMRSPFPNPFTSETVIQFTLPTPADRVSLTVYDVRGRQVSRLLHEVPRVSGIHAVEWNGRDGGGVAVPSGVYFYELVVDGQPQGVRRAVRIK